MKCHSAAKAGILTVNQVNEFKKNPDLGHTPRDDQDKFWVKLYM